MKSAVVNIIVIITRLVLNCFNYWTEELLIFVPIFG